MRYSSAIAIHWSSGDPGKGPITRYVIEARPSGTPTESASHRSRLPSPHVAHFRVWSLEMVLALLQEKLEVACVSGKWGGAPLVKEHPRGPPRMPLSAR